MLLHTRVGGFRAAAAAAGPPLIRASSTAETATQTGTITISNPSGLAAGDLIYALVGTHRNNQDPHLNAEGCATIEFSASGSLGATLFRKVVVAGDITRGNFTYTKAVVGTDGYMQGGIIAFQAGTFNAGTSEDATTVSAVGSGDTTIDCPSITTVTNNAVVIYFAIDVIRAITGFPGITSGFYIKHANAGAGVCVAYYKTQASAGASGTATYTMTANENWQAWTVAVRPA